MTVKTAIDILLKSPATLALHVALCVIVAGALVTHFTGIEGKVTLKEGAPAVKVFDMADGEEGVFPFALALAATEVSYYPHTTSPSDFASDLMVTMPDGSVVHGRVAMNRVFECSGWRFYQTGIGSDSSTLTVAHDPVGIGVTYTGYILLGVSMLLFMLSPHTGWRAALRRVSTVIVLCLGAQQGGTAAELTEVPKTIQRPLAREFGKLMVYHEGRIRPLSAFARDFTQAVYGSDMYRGLTAEQVLAGWLFYYDQWKREPMIKVSGKRLRGVVGVDGEYASLRDFYSPAGYKLEPLLSDRTDRKALDADARVALISTVATGSAFRLFPYVSTAGVTEWLSWGSRRPSAMGDADWELISGSLPEINLLLRSGLNIEADGVFKRIAANQESILGREGADVPGVIRRCRVEATYMRYARLFPLAGVLILVGFGGVLLHGAQRCGKRRLAVVQSVIICAAMLYLVAVLGARWYVTGHIPMASGHETMLTMGLIALVGAVCAHGRWVICRSALALVGGLAVLVAAMSGNSPQMGPLLPVLASPWLSVHVMLVMTAYALAAMMLVIAVTALRMRNGVQRLRLTALNEVILLPTVFLLAAGIFIGAVWANQSWGRYWGWDPKETCALVTMLIYALPLHRRSLPPLRRPIVLNMYLAIAFAAVLFTYFGANYLLPGLHSYA